MEEIRRAAGAYYNHLPENHRELVRKILDEYVEYLKEKKAKDLTHQSIFSALDKDGNGSFDFDDAIVLFYIMQSGRAIICKGCDSFLAGAYFSCSECFFDNDDSVSTFDVCCDCYGGKNFRHNDGHIFCDNYTLLSRSRSVIQEAPIKKRTSSDIEGIVTGDDDVDSSISNCSIM